MRAIFGGVSEPMAKSSQNPVPDRCVHYLRNLNIPRDLPNASVARYTIFLCQLLLSSACGGKNSVSWRA
jgi:hypothetical protein